MFVELMTDLRKTVASMAFRTQIAPQQPRIQAPRRLTLSGPSEPGADPTGAPTPLPQAPPPEKADALAAAFAGSRRVERAAVGSAVGAGAPMDVSRLQTNRGEAAEAKSEPVRVEAKVGRNDPCPCGSGRKYKKCHGVGAT